MQPYGPIPSDHFGVEALRSFQRDAVDALLGGAGRVLLVAPTGGGKSLCHQLPAVLLEGTALVLSPLIALMEGVRDRAILGACPLAARPNWSAPRNWS